MGREGGTILGVRDRLIGDPHNFIVDPQIFIGNPILFVLNPKFSLEANSRFSFEGQLFIGAARFSLKTLDFYLETPNFSPKPQIFSEETTRCSLRPKTFCFNLKFSDLQSIRFPVAKTI